MDANVTWTQQGNQYAGTLHLYLTDTDNVSGLNIQLGTEADSSDLVSTQYALDSGGSFQAAGGTVDANNMLHVPVGSYAYHPDYYAKVTLMLDGAASQEIVVHSSN